MKKVTIKKIAKQLKRQKDLGNSSIIFLGAGASVSSGIPVGRDLVEYIRNHEHFCDLVPETDDYFGLMEQLTPAERKRVFAHFIDEIKVNSTHFIVALLIYLGYVDLVITTNFDPLMKHSLTLLRQDIPVIDVPNNVSISAQNLSTPRIYFLHGEHSNVWQYNTLKELDKKKGDIHNLISEFSKNRTWVVVGYSGNDPVFEAFTSFEKFDNNLFWIGYREETPQHHIQKHLLQDKTKHAHYLNGYNSDEFFEALVREFDIQSKDFFNYLDLIILQADTQRKIHADKSIHISKNLKPIDLTTSCKKWVVEFKKNQAVSTDYPIPKKWISRLTSIFVNGERKLINLILKEHYHEVIDRTSKLLKENPNNSMAYYFKGIALLLFAETLNPIDRKSEYVKAKEALITANKLDKRYQDAEEYIYNAWGNEYNSGVKILTDDSTKKATPDPNKTAIAHFENAVIFQPDSALTYQIMSSAYYNEQEVSMAISTYEKAMECLEEPKVLDYEYLISLYLVEEEHNKAIDLSEQAMEDHPDEAVFVQYLADAYMQSGNRDLAIDFVQNLIDEDPDNPQYRRVLGTQIYQTVDQLNNKVLNLYEKLFDLRKESRGLSGEEQQEAENHMEAIQAEIKEAVADIDELVQISIREMEQVVEMEPNDEEANFILGIIYQNHAANLFERRNNTTDTEQVNAYDDEARENLRNALTNYERAAELNPDNPEYWQSLYQVYTTLGMEEEAKRVISIGLTRG